MRASSSVEDVQEPEASATRRRVPRAGLALGVLALVGVGTWLVFDGQAAPDPGPLVLPEGHSIVLAPTDEPAWVTVGGCTAEPIDLHVTDVEVLDAWSEDEATWLVAWPRELFEIGADAGTVPQPPFTELVEDDGGRSVPCGVGEEGPLLAVQFPAGEVDRGFDRIRVHYTVDGTDHVSEHDVSFGVCGPRDVSTHCSER